MSDAELALLHAAVKRLGSSEVARKLGVSEGSVRGWVAGTSSPRAKACTAIREALGAQDKKAVLPSVRVASPPLSRPQDEGAKGEVTDHDDPRANAVAALRKIRAALEQVKDDDADTIARLSTPLTGLSRLLARLSGTLDVTEAQILRSAAWARLLRVIRGVLETYPGAAGALDKAMADYEAAS